MDLVQPVPWTDLLAPEYTRKRGDRNYDFAWEAGDAQGMPGHPSGGRVHGGVDMFGPGNSTVKAPLSGTVVRAVTGGGVTGQVFGGILAVESSDGIAVQFRHINPSVSVGTAVAAGDPVATITAWQGGWPHAHTEVYKSWPAPYDFRFTIDPRKITWVESMVDLAPVADFFFEELPHDQGGTGPVIVWHGKGNTAPAVAIHKARGRIVSTVRDADGIGYVLWWKDGTYPNVPVFGPWADEAVRDIKVKRREANTGRTMRPFRGRHRSAYPIAGR